jgi:hypothetical protein
MSGDNTRFTKEYKVTVDANDVGVGAKFQFVFKSLTKSSKNNPQLKKKITCLIEAIMMYISSIRDAY